MFLNPNKKKLSLLRSAAIRQALILLSVFTIVTSIAWLASYWLALGDTKKLVELRLVELVDAAKIAVINNEPLPDARPGQYLVIKYNDGRLDGKFPEEIATDGLAFGVHHLESTENTGQTDYVVLIEPIAMGKILVAENVERLEEITDIFLAGLRYALLTSVVLTFISGYYIARKNQARLDRISQGLASVSQGELSQRISLPGGNDDLKLLADRIDATTARLESTMTRMRVQTANIAHDLRTPLARLRALLEEHYLAIINGNKAVSSDVLASALEQTDKIVEIFNAILRIAQIESGAQRSSFTSINLGDLMQQVAETFGPVVEDQSQLLQINQESPSTIAGDANLIVLLMGNLIQNALRYGAGEQTITLQVKGLLLQVIDEGPGIPIEEREQVLQPLYQRQRQQDGEGYGLGLALVKAICDLHGASLTLENQSDRSGLLVSVKFPTACTSSI